MPRLSINLSEAQSRKPLPDDSYICKIIVVSDVKVAKESKAKMVEAQYQVAEGEHQGRIIFQNLMLEGKGASIFCDVWAAATGETIDLDDPEVKRTGLNVDTDDLVGKTICVVTKQDEYPAGSGTFNHKVTKVLEAAGF